MRSGFEQNLSPFKIFRVEDDLADNWLSTRLGWIRLATERIVCFTRIILGGNVVKNYYSERIVI